MIVGLNLWALQYVLEVAKTGSISRAAQNLLLSQPHLSNTIKTIESELGTPLFLRSPKGMTLTEAGRIFVQEAASILERVEQLESRFHTDPEERVELSVSTARSYRVNQCMDAFIMRYKEKAHIQFHVRETNPFQVLEDVRTHKAELGFLHIFEPQKEYFLSRFKAESLQYHLQYDHEFLILVSAQSRLAREKTITRAMLEKQILVLYGDYENSAASYRTVEQVSDLVLSPRRIYVYERATAMETLRNCPNSYMWITGVHPDTLQQYGLALRRCPEVKVHNLGYRIRNANIALSAPAAELLSMLDQVDWTEQDTGPTS